VKIDEDMGRSAEVEPGEGFPKLKRAKMRFQLRKYGVCNDEEIEGVVINVWASGGLGWGCTYVVDERWWWLKEEKFGSCGGRGICRQASLSESCLSGMQTPIGHSKGDPLPIC
jgi:hypothetical protein